MTTSIPLGAFQLHEPLAKGGMGHVWAGVHQASGAAVAVKFLTHKSASDPRFRAAFRNEVRSVAGLDHPHIATVYDHGEVTEQAHEQSGGALPLHAPWLAMELVSGGTLHDFAGRLGWFEVRHIALSLLDALAHAHARGVIHRDMKPSNVLIRWHAHIPQVTLTDFGLAHEAEEAGRDAEGHFYGGTPSYMAPEQYGGQWRDYGPWTDLYGLGCLIWALIRGQPPFGPKASYEEKRRQHLREAPPPLDPPYDVPEGLEAWLRRLLAKDPAKRFRRAADATWALRSLAHLEGDEPITVVPMGADIEVPSGIDTLVLDGPSTSGPTASDHTTLSLAPGEAGQVAMTLATTEADVPPHPPDWRGGSPRRGIQLMGAGIGLFGLRSIPLVDRELERDRLWNALAEVRRLKRPRLVALTGASGTGKSRLADWLSTRSHEVGAAITLRAEHSPIPGGGQGLGPMLQRYLRCYGLTRDETAERVEAIFRAGGVDHEDEWAALTEVIQPGAGQGHIRFRSSTERYITVRRLLAGLCSERPVVIWLDDVQWGLDALGFCQHVLGYRGERPLPVLIVVTGTDEALAERGDERTLLQVLLARDTAERIDVGPLPEAYRATLVQELLGLDPHLAHRLEERAGGNPQFAVQLVGDWVQRRLLEAGPNGYVLRDGESIQLPRDVTQLWASRVGRLLASRSAAEGRALEVAAVLGAEVDPSEWEAVCRRASMAGTGLECDPSSELLDVLLDQRFARTGSEGPARGWTFAHAMLRESLVHRAESFERLQDHHAACAAVLGDRFEDSGGSDWRLAERLGRHLLLSGQPDAAEGALLMAAEARATTGDYAVADALLDQRDGALEAAFVLPGDERWGEGWMARHQVALGKGDYEGAQRWLDRLEVGSTAHSWPTVGVQAMALRGAQHRMAGEYDKALEVSKRSVARADRLGNPRLIADSQILVAGILVERGDLTGGERWARQALEQYEAAGYDVGSARVWQMLGQIATEAGRHGEAGRILREAEHKFEKVGDRWGMASAITSRGDVARFQGRLEQAMELYRRARGLFRAIGSVDWTFPEVNIAMVHLARREYGDAREILEQMLPRFVARGERRVQTTLLVGLAACAAADQRWLMYDDYMNEAGDNLRVAAAFDEETARLLSMTGDVAVAKGESERAIRAYQRAAEQWRTLGRGREAGHIEEFIARLRSGR